MYVGNKSQEKMVVRLLSGYCAIFFLLIASISSTVLHEQQATAQKKTTTSSFSATKPTPPPTTSNFLTYQDPTYGIKIQYPSDWTMSKTGLRDYTNIVAFYSPLQNLTAVPSQF